MQLGHLQVFAMHQQRDREEAVLEQMSRVTVSPQQQQQQLDPAWSMAALRTDVAELARQTAGEAAVVARMAELELGGGAGLRAAMSGLQLEPHQAALEAPPNPSYTEYMMQRARLEASSSSSSRSPLFLSALASHALQLGPQ